MTAALCTEASELLVLVPLTSFAKELGVRILGRTGFAALTANDAKALLREVRAGEVVAQVGREEDQRAVVESLHLRRGSSSGWVT